MIRFVTDEHLPNALADALTDLGVDVTRVHDVGLASTPDPIILAWAASESRVFVTFDRNTVPGFAYDRVRAGEPMAGVVVLPDDLSLGAMIDELHVLAACGTAADVQDQVRFLPE